MWVKPNGRQYVGYELKLFYQRVDSSDEVLLVRVVLLINVEEKRCQYCPYDSSATVRRSVAVFWMGIFVFAHFLCDEYGM